MAGPVDLGYSLATTAPNGYRLEVWMREHPTERHFDPERTQFVIAEDGGLGTLEVRHPALGPGEYQVCAGRVLLTDRINKVVAVFTFGGHLAVATQPTVTACRLESAAPLLQIEGDSSSPIELLIEETEVLLAERRAARLADPGEYERRLAGLDPLELYTACLYTIAGLIARRHPGPEQPDTHLLHHIRAEERRLAEAGLWPSLPSVIDDVL